MRLRRNRTPARGQPDGARWALFDAATEEPALLEADRQARRDRRDRRDRGDRGDRKERRERADPRARAGAPAVDPRIAARRSEVEAKAAAGALRRRRLAGAVIGLTVVVGGGGLYLISPLASVRTIVVTGAARTAAADVRWATGLSGGTPLVRIDEDAVRARVVALPWVKGARLERRWPSTVVIDIDERQPAALVACHAAREAACLVDADGRVLGGASDAPAWAGSLPTLLGLPAGTRPGETMPDEARGPLAVAAALPAALRPLVVGVRGEGTEVSLDLRAPGRDDTPPVVRLGPADRIPDKLTAAATVLARTSVNGVAVLDVRVPESPAVTRVRR